MRSHISWLRSLGALLLYVVADAALPNPIRVGFPPVNYPPWQDCGNGICRDDQMFMPILHKELSHRLNVKFSYRTFTRNFTATTFIQRIMEDLDDDYYDIAWGWLVPGADPYNFPGLKTRMAMTPPFFSGDNVALITKKTADVKLFRFLEPFHWDLWLAVIVCLFIVSGAMVLIQVVDPRDGTTGKPSWRFAVTTVYHSWAAVLGGEDYEWMTASARVLRIALLFLVLITGATYTANLAAFFTKPSFKFVGPKTVAQLKDSTICLTYSTNLRAYAPFVKKAIAPPDTLGNDLNGRIDWCRDEIRNGNADALVEPISTAQGVLLKNCQTMARAKDIAIVPQQFVYFLRGDKPELLAALTAAIADFMISPAYPNLLQTAFSMGRSCEQEEIDEDAPEINFKQMRGFFVIFMVILVVAVLVAFLKALSDRFLGEPDNDDCEAMTDAEMIVNLNEKVDQLLSRFPAGTPAGEAWAPKSEKTELTKVVPHMD